MMDGRIETQCQFVWLDGEGIIHVVVKPMVDVDLVHACEAADAVAKLWRGVRRPALVDMRGLRTITRAARQHFAAPATIQHETAVALLVGSPVTRAIGNFFLGLNKTAVPTRLFSREDDALLWLRAHRLPASA